MSNRDEYVARMKAQLEQWTLQMMTWESAARNATAEARAEWEKQIGILKSRLDDMSFRMEQLQDASETAWQDIAHGAEEARKSMHDAFEKARTRFKDQ